MKQQKKIIIENSASNQTFANDHDNQIDNTSPNKRFSDFIQSTIKRRDLLKGGVAAAVTGFVSGALPSSVSATSGRYSYYYKKGAINFSPVPVAQGNGPTPTISDDYQFDVLIPWGEPLEPNGPNYSYPPTASDQAEQIGIGHDGMTFFPRRYRNSRKSNRIGMLAINHEFGRTDHVLGKPLPESLQDVRTMQHAHGVSVVAIGKTKRGGAWRTLKSDDSRRIHVNTPVNFSGPAADSTLLDTPNGNTPLGTVNNCSNGETPWGTYL